MARSILVVDDHPASAAVLVDLLAGEGYRVRCAYDGQAALRAITQAPPDLVLSDVMMPKMDGVTLARQLRARGWALPVVLMSAECAAVDVPGVPLLQKPLDLDGLLKMIARIIAAPGPTQRAPSPQRTSEANGPAPMPETGALLAAEVQSPT